MVVPWKLDLPLKGYTIILNPGHGALNSKGITDKGTSGVLNGKTIFESDLNDLTAQKVRYKLQAMGADVVYVDNKTSQEVQDIEKKIKPDLFLSIHHNALVGQSWFGGESTYAWSEDGLKAARQILSKLEADNSIPTRDIDIEYSKKLKVLNVGEDFPAVLLEPGYLSSESDIKVLNTDEYQETLTQKIVEGIKAFFEVKKSENPPVKVEKTYTESLLEPYFLNK